MIKGSTKFIDYPAEWFGPSEKEKIELDATYLMMIRLPPEDIVSYLVTCLMGFLSTDLEILLGSLQRTWMNVEVTRVILPVQRAITIISLTSILIPLNA